jgi:putative MATE family efflux protein
MQAMAAGGMGGAVTATIAKAAGSGDRDKVRSLAVHAVLIALACGVVFAVAMHVFGPAFYRLLGGRDGALDAALAYSNVLFLGAPLMWVVIIFAAVLRGLGVTKVQAVVSVTGSLVLIPLSPALIFGVGPIPALGIAGAALAVICYYVLLVAMYVSYLRSAKSVIRFHREDFTPSLAEFVSILRLGGVSSLLAVQSHITALMITGLAGSFGTVVLAGFGAAIRLQQVVEPFIFSLGTATVVMVATCMGAGNAERARKAAMTTALTATTFYGLVGVFVTIFPNTWVSFFSNDPGVIAAGAVYQRTMGPVYWCYGLALVAYYCSQGVGRMRWSYAGSLLRLVIISIAGTVLLSAMHGGPATLYRIVAVAVVISCAVSVLGIARNDWEKLLSARLKPAA